MLPLSETATVSSQSALLSTRSPSSLFKLLLHFRFDSRVWQWITQEEEEEEEEERRKALGALNWH